MKKPNRNQVHLPTQLSKPSMLQLKQKEPMAIRKSLLSKPIIMSKSTATTGRTDATTVGPCKPAGLKRPAQKLTTRDHPLQLTAVSGNSTPIKDQTSRRRSVAVSPQQDSSVANDNCAIQAKQRRRSGIPLPGGVVRSICAICYTGCVLPCACGVIHPVCLPPNVNQ